MMTPEKLKAILAESKMSPHDFMRMVDVTAPTIYNFLKGKKVSKATLADIENGAKMLTVSDSEGMPPL